MKTINALLNSLLSTPADQTAQSQSQNPVSSKGSKPNGSTFGNVLAQVASQNSPVNQGNTQQNQPPAGSISSGGNATTSTLAANAVSAPNAGGGTSAGSFTSVSETTVAIQESVKAGNTSQLAAAEQALVSLVGGLAQLIQLISSLQQSNPQQAQAALATLSNMNLTPAGLQSILNTLQPLVQKLPADQNPLLLSSSQQAGLINQMFQQMMQAQQVILGGGAANQANTSNQVSPAANNLAVTSLGAVGPNNGQNATLQMFFSNANLTGITPNQVQSTQVLINLANFKMSATFIQAGTGDSADQNPVQTPLGVQSQTATPINSQNVIAELNQVLASLGNANSPTAVTEPTQTNTANDAGLQNNLSQNFKGLVQLLMQSGVTQAALTSFIANQQKGGENPNSANVSQNTGQTVSANNLTQVSPVSSEIQPVIPAVLTGGSTNNANIGQPTLPAENNFAVNEIVSRAPIPFVQPSVGGNSKTSSTIENTQVLPNVPQQPLIQSAVNQVAVNSILNGQQQGGENQNSTNVSQNVGQTVSANNPTQVSPVSSEIQPMIPATLTGAPTTNSTAQLPPVQAAGIETSFGLNVKEINTLNAVVASLNASALHPTQGGLSMGSNTVLPSSALTMGQILGASEANQISSGSIVVPNGNPSVPLVPPVPLQAPLPTSNPNNVILSQLPQSQQSQAQTATSSTTTGSQTVTVLSTISPEPVNPPVQPLIPGAQNVALNNLTSNNGVVTSPSGLNNGTSASPTAVSPTLTVVGNGASNTPTTNNPVINNPLPQPATLPNSGTTPLPANNNPSTPRFIAPTSLNQTGNPAPTSQAPAVPALATVGEAVKTEIPNQAAGNNNNPQTGLTNSQPDATIKPSSPEAVSPVVSVSNTNSTTTISNVSGKNAPNNSTVLAANALLTSNTNTPNQGHASSAFSLGVATASNAGPTGSIDSAQVLNQILQQVAAQTADAKTISRLSFQLVPESLGKVTVQIALIDQSVSARMIVTNPEIKEVLQSHMVDLKTALNQAGLQIDQLQVQVQGGAAIFYPNITNINKKVQVIGFRLLLSQLTGLALLMLKIQPIWRLFPPARPW